jgi:hypothetical protein
MAVAARLRHLAGTEWGRSVPMDMGRLATASEEVNSEGVRRVVTSLRRFRHIRAMTGSQLPPALSRLRFLLPSVWAPGNVVKSPQRLARVPASAVTHRAGVRFAAA